MERRGDLPPPATPGDVINELRHLYLSKIHPVESSYKFGDFHSPLLRGSDFDAKPMVLLLGQYSVGKTTFIRYLLGRDFPGIRIGPEPTTDRFVAVMHGPDDRVIPGNALAVHEDMPFTSLVKYGTDFLNKLECSQCNAPLLEKITLIDTPGVLSGEKQRIGRSYDFVSVVEWFAQRADMILLLFDAHKLDISDEFKRTIECLKGQDDKIRVVLNKADKVNPQQLMRVYGAMMWALGKVVNTPEVMRVYIGSFRDRSEADYGLTMVDSSFRELFQKEQADLLKDLANLPRYAAIRRINELVKRARLAKVHALIIAHLRGQMPSMWGKEKKQRELLENLADQFFAVQKKHRLPIGDFPNLARFRDVASTFEFKEFPKLDPKLIETMDRVLSRGIPHLLHQLAAIDQESGVKSSDFGLAAASVHGAGGMGAGAGAGSSVAAPSAPVAPTPAPAPAPAPAPPPVSAAAPRHVAAPPVPSTRGGSSNPFDAPKKSGGASGNPFGAAPAAETEQSKWERAIGKTFADEKLATLPTEEGMLSGMNAKPVFEEYGVTPDLLRQIWDLSDMDEDGFLDPEEFAVAMYLLKQASTQGSLPPTLATDLVPPSRR